MYSLIHKSLRCFLFGFLLFAGATDLFSVDLDQDGDVDTDVVIAFDHTVSVSQSIPVSQRAMVAAVHIFRRIQTQAELMAPLAPRNAPDLALGSPQLLVPLRT